jgi:hypothetical protein
MLLVAKLSDRFRSCPVSSSWVVFCSKTWLHCKVVAAKLAELEPVDLHLVLATSTGARLCAPPSATFHHHIYTNIIYIYTHIHTLDLAFYMCIMRCLDVHQQHCLDVHQQQWPPGICSLTATLLPAHPARRGWAVVSLEWPPSQGPRDAPPLFGRHSAWRHLGQFFISTCRCITTLRLYMPWP